MTPHVTVVVCTRDRPRQLEACLDALAQQTYSTFDILVVDNGSSDEAGDICGRRGVACIREAVPGLTRARNLGARAARGELVAYIDDDAVAGAGWLEALSREFEDPRVAAAAGWTHYMAAAGDTLTMTGQPVPDQSGPRPHRRFDRTIDGWFAQACFGGIGDGNTMMFRRSVLTGAVRFDERIGRGRLIDSGDEHVAFMSLISDGHHVVRTPAAVVRHPAPGDLVSRRAKRFRDLRGSVAYLLFLWCQFPTHRGDIVRFIWRRVAHRRTIGPVTVGAALSVAQILSALVGGVRLYLAAARAWALPSHKDTPVARVVTLR